MFSAAWGETKSLDCLNRNRVIGTLFKPQITGAGVLTVVILGSLSTGDIN